jgi:hypothetical protein
VDFTGEAGIDLLADIGAGLLITEGNVGEEEGEEAVSEVGC